MSAGAPPGQHSDDRDALTVVIPAFNEGSSLPAVLAALRGWRVSPAIIVVDDGSTDGTAGVVQGFGDIVRCIRQRNAGVSA